MAVLAQVLRFGMVGIAATLMHVLVAYAAHSTFALAPQWANLAGFAAAVAVSYLGHARFTFAVTAGSGPQVLRFILVSAASLVISSATVWLVTDRLRYPFPVAMALITVLVPAASFLAMRFWVFTLALHEKSPP